MKEIQPIPGAFHWCLSLVLSLSFHWRTSEGDPTHPRCLSLSFRLVISTDPFAVRSMSFHGYFHCPFHWSFPRMSFHWSLHCGFAGAAWRPATGHDSSPLAAGGARATALSFSVFRCASAPQRFRSAEKGCSRHSLTAEPKRRSTPSDTPTRHLFGPADDGASPIVAEAGSACWSPSGSERAAAPHEAALPSDGPSSDGRGAGPHNMDYHPTR